MTPIASHQARHDRQTHSRTKAHRLGGKEGVKNSAANLRIDTATRITNLQTHPPAFYPLSANGAYAPRLRGLIYANSHYPSTMHRVVRIRTQIEKNLLYMQRID